MQFSLSNSFSHKMHSNSIYVALTENFIEIQLIDYKELIVNMIT